MIKKAIIDFLSLSTAGGIFIGGIYVAYFYNKLIAALILIVISFALAFFISCFEIVDVPNGKTTKIKNKEEKAA